MNPIAYNDYYFHINDEDPSEIKIQLTTSIDPFSTSLWSCILKGLWSDPFVKETTDLNRVWTMHAKGDYFQQTINRSDKTIHPNTSYTAWFHDMLSENKNEFTFIKNLYSTSTLSWLSFGYKIYDPAIRFWEKQINKGKATYIDSEGRYKAILR